MADDAKYILQFWNVNTPSWNIASTAMTFEPVPVACIEADDRMDIVSGVPYVPTRSPASPTTSGMEEVLDYLPFKPLAQVDGATPRRLKPASMQS